MRVGRDSKQRFMAVFQWQQSPNVGNTGSSKVSDPNLSETVCLEKPSDLAADYATLSFTLVARMRTRLSSDTMPSSSLQKSRAVLCIHGFGAFPLPDHCLPFFRMAPTLSRHKTLHET